MDIKTSKIMNASLNHLSKDDEVEFFGGTSPFRASRISRDEYLVQVPNVDVLPKSDHTSAFLKLLGVAKKNKCKYIEFLKNGTIYEQFENFERLVN